LVTARPMVADSFVLVDKEEKGSCIEEKIDRAYSMANGRVELLF
jgi:hypothetical protein